MKNGLIFDTHNMAENHNKMLKRIQMTYKNAIITCITPQMISKMIQVKVINELGGKWAENSEFGSPLVVQKVDKRFICVSPKYTISCHNYPSECPSLYAMGDVSFFDLEKEYTLIRVRESDVGEIISKYGVEIVK